jgi:hypothetical protein
MQQHDTVKPDTENKDAAVQPDPETLHKTDPQDNMKGPISSLMQGIKEDFEEGDKETVKKEEGEILEGDDEDEEETDKKGNTSDGSE